MASGNHAPVGDNLSIRDSTIKWNLFNSASTTAIFLDIRGAYDNVLSDVLINILKSIGISGKSLKFIYNLTHRRILHFRYGDIDEYRQVYRGLPQGSVLSPILYSLYVLELEPIIQSNKNVKIIQFADDVCLFSSDKDTHTALRYLKRCANLVSCWYERMGLTLAPEKTQLCVFSRLPSIRRIPWSVNIDSLLNPNYPSVS